VVNAAVENSAPLTAAEVRAAVAIANVPALLMVVFQFTGDERWLAEPYLPTRGKGLGDHDDGGLPPSIQDEIRAAAERAILALQAGVTPAIESPSVELIVRMMSACMGERVAPQYGPMLSAELARRIDPQRPDLQLEPVNSPPGYRTIVIGSGIAGIAAAQQLEEMGIDYVVIEKQANPGGVWWQNQYPGAGVDTPSHIYSFFFAQNDWQRHFALRPDLNEYFASLMERLGVAERVRYGTEVLSATYEPERVGWRVEVRNPDGTVETLRADIVISAVGSLNRPRMLDVPGRDTFAGLAFHSSQWPADLELDGRRVVVVGAGASSMQISCDIADRVQHLTIVQRSPQWVAPFEKFHRQIPDELRRLLQSCTLYYGWYWIRLFWQFGDKVIEALRVDPEWEHPERSVNARNDGHREFFTRYIESQLKGREDLLDVVMPDYPPFGKRILLDNGWFSTLRRDDVTLVTDSVAAVDATGVITGSGEHLEADVIIWATGFQAARFVSSLEVRGLDGVSLHETWHDDDPRAYLGVSVPRFPNFFILGGPNSFPGSGSFMFFMEVQMRYIRRLMTEMFKRGIRALDASDEANDAYNELVDQTHAQTVWTHPGMSTYYRNSKGRVVFVMPFLNVEYWEMTNHVDLDKYQVRS
jgi:4-hydroxyacetophenone monooxygenase